MTVVHARKLIHELSALLSCRYKQSPVKSQKYVLFYMVAKHRFNCSSTVLLKASDGFLENLRTLLYDKQWMMCGLWEVL